MEDRSEGEVMKTITTEQILKAALALGAEDFEVKEAETLIGTCEFMLVRPVAMHLGHSIDGLTIELSAKLVAVNRPKGLMAS